MIAKHMTDPFVTLPRRLNAVSDGSCLQAHSPIKDDTSVARCCAKHPFVPSCNHARASRRQHSRLQKPTI